MFLNTHWNISPLKASMPPVHKAFIKRGSLSLYKMYFSLSLRFPKLSRTEPNRRVAKRRIRSRNESVIISVILLFINDYCVFLDMYVFAF